MLAIGIHHVEFNYARARNLPVAIDLQGIGPKLDGCERARHELFAERPPIIVVGCPLRQSGLPNHGRNYSVFQTSVGLSVFWKAKNA